MGGFDRAQQAYDNQLPPEGPVCTDCGDWLDEDDDTLCGDCAYALGGHDMTEES